MSKFDVSRFVAQLVLDTDSLKWFLGQDSFGENNPVFPLDESGELDMGAIEQQFGGLTIDEVKLLDSRDLSAIGKALAEAGGIRPIHDGRIGGGGGGGTGG